MKKQVKKELLWLLGTSALALFATKKRSLALLPTLAGAALLLNTNKKDSFENQTVVITGGSRGLGFALAKQLLEEKANVAILARDPQELARAQEKLEALDGGTVRTIVCDVTKKSQLDKAFQEIAENFGGIDMLINNAGAITVGPWETMTQADFEAQMKIHVYAPLNTIRMALPFLRKEKSGKRIVNICSMGGRVAVPHMLPYDTSKFALAGFSQGVGAELAHEGISVTTIYPALMRTGSPIQAVFKGDHEKEFAWFQTGDVFPFLSLGAEEAAQEIIEAARDRRWELMPSWPAKLRMAAGAFMPELMGSVMSSLNVLLPPGSSTEYKTGAQSRRLFDNFRWTQALAGRAHKAEEEFNQEPKSDAKFNMGLH